MITLLHALHQYTCNNLDELVRADHSYSLHLHDANILRAFNPCTVFTVRIYTYILDEILFAGLYSPNLMTKSFDTERVSLFPITFQGFAILKIQIVLQNEWCLTAIMARYFGLFFLKHHVM